MPTDLDDLILLASAERELARADRRLTWLRENVPNTLNYTDAATDYAALTLYLTRVQWRIHAAEHAGPPEFMHDGTGDE